MTSNPWHLPPSKPNRFTVDSVASLLLTADSTFDAFLEADVRVISDVDGLVFVELFEKNRYTGTRFEVRIKEVGWG